MDSESQENEVGIKWPGQPNNFKQAVTVLKRYLTIFIIFLVCFGAWVGFQIYTMSNGSHRVLTEVVPSEVTLETEEKEVGERKIHTPSSTLEAQRAVELQETSGTMKNTEWPAFELPEDLVRASPIDCLPRTEFIPGYQRDWSYVSTVMLNEHLSTYEAGKRYGNFVYEGYMCEKSALFHDGGVLHENNGPQVNNTPQLYFSGDAEVRLAIHESDMGGAYSVSLLSGSEMLPEVVERGVLEYMDYEYSLILDQFDIPYGYQSK